MVKISFEAVNLPRIDLRIKGKTLDVVTVTTAKAKFRFSGDSTVTPEVELEPGGRQDLWLGTFGVRLRVEKVRAYPLTIFALQINSRC